MKFMKILDIRDGIVAARLESALSERKIPHVIRSMHDTAYDGLYQAISGWGWVEAPEEERGMIVELYADIAKAREPVEGGENRSAGEAAEPEETFIEETSPEETSPEETSPEETSPEETSPGETSPGETSPGETAAEKADRRRLGVKLLVAFIALMALAILLALIRDSRGQSPDRRINQGTESSFNPA